MASGGHILQQQKPVLENHIKTLTNAKLQEICRAFGQNVSGTKAILQKRCLDVLEGIVRRGDVNLFEDLRAKANLEGLSPFQQNRFQSPSSQYNSPAYQSFNMAPQRGGGGLPGRPPGGKYFKPSPFYEMIDTVLTLQDLPEGPEMPQNRHTVRANFNIKPEVAQQCRIDNVKILMYCGLSHAMSPFSQVDIAFPNQIEVKINDQDQKHNFKGLKNKPGSTKPADITSLVRKMNSQNNSIQVTYALTNKRYAYMIYAVRYISAGTLTERLKKGNVIPKDKVLVDMSKANADPDIAATSVRMSLKDPISTMRITLPIRASHCTHNQCYDGAMFMQLQEQAPQWSCPVCSKAVSFESLCVDKYFEDILNRTTRSIEKVDIEPNGEWRVIKEDDDTQANGNSSRNARASYDDDFDDDIVELDQATNKQVNGVKMGSQPPNMLSPMMGQSFMNTPPLSSREPSVAQSASSAQRQTNKRPQSSIIDLTISDDEDDDPPRLAKRQSTSQNLSQRAQQSYNTPPSLPDFRSYQPQQQQQTQNYGGTNSYGGGGADKYRPSSISQKAQQAPTSALSLSNHNSNTNNTSNNSNTNSNNHNNPPPSPMRASPYSNQPGWPGRPTPSNNTNTSNGMFPAPPISNFQIRPPSSSSSHHHQNQSLSPPVNGPYGGSGSVGGQHAALRLPPMHPHQPSSNSSSPNPYGNDNWSGWRDGGGGYGGYGGESPG